MATSVQIDPDLLEQAMNLSGEKTKKATVTRALREFIARRRQSQLLDLFGSLDWDPEYSRSERSRR